MSWLISGEIDKNDIMAIKKQYDMESNRNKSVPTEDGIFMPGPPKSAEPGFIRTTKVDVKKLEYIYEDIPEPIPPDPDIPTWNDLLNQVENLMGEKDHDLYNESSEGPA